MLKVASRMAKNYEEAVTKDESEIKYRGIKAMPFVIGIRNGSELIHFPFIWFVEDFFSKCSICKN